MSYSQKGSLVDMLDVDLARETVLHMADVGGDWLLERAILNTPVSYTGLALNYQGFGAARTPGTLKRRWRRGPVEPILHGMHGGARVPVENTDPIASFVEYPTAPHVIRPKLPGGVLVFRTWPTGELVHAKVVHHPGTHGQYMLTLAVNAAEIAFDEIVRRPLEEWARRSEAKAHA